MVGSAATESVAASDLGSEMMEADCRIETLVRGPTLVVKDGLIRMEEGLCLVHDVFRLFLKSQCRWMSKHLCQKSPRRVDAFYTATTCVVLKPRLTWDIDLV